MSPQGSSRTFSPQLYAREIQMSLQNNSGAFGYSVSITCALAMITALNRAPNVLQILLFGLGAVASFLVVEASVTRLFRRSHGGDEQSKVVALGSSIGILSVSSAIGATALTAWLLPATLSWFLASFISSMTYLLINAVEMSVARWIEERRGLA